MPVDLNIELYIMLWEPKWISYQIFIDHTTNILQYKTTLKFIILVLMGAFDCICDYVCVCVCVGKWWEWLYVSVWVTVRVGECEFLWVSAWVCWENLYFSISMKKLENIPFFEANLQIYKDRNTEGEF